MISASVVAFIAWTATVVGLVASSWILKQIRRKWHATRVVPPDDAKHASLSGKVSIALGAAAIFGNIASIGMTTLLPDSFWTSLLVLFTLLVGLVSVPMFVYAAATRPQLRNKAIFLLSLTAVTGGLAVFSWVRRVFLGA